MLDAEGVTVVSLPFYEWAELPDEKAQGKYLQKIIDEGAAKAKLKSGGEREQQRPWQRQRQRRSGSCR